MSRRTPARPSTSNGIHSALESTTASTSTAVVCPKKSTERDGHLEHRDNSTLYPLSYSPSIIGLDVLDHVNLMRFRQKPSWLDYGDSPPKRALDLGCGTGAWILDAAKQWPNCYFVGYDIAKIQPRQDTLPLMISERICWLHGNFLEENLPFEDDFFDYVHISHIAWGVPETAWDGLCENISRILRPGGVVEIEEEDILFPTLPRSYTLKTKQARPLSYIKNIDTIISISPLNGLSPVPHAHALIESLFFGVFEKRMINLRPTSIIPHHLNIHFRKVTSTAALDVPFPPPPLSRLRLHDIATSEMSRTQNSHPQTQTQSSSPVSTQSRSGSVSSLELSDQGQSSFDSPDPSEPRRQNRPIRQAPPQHYSRLKPLPPPPPSTQRAESRQQQQPQQQPRQQSQPQPQPQSQLQPQQNTPTSSHSPSSSISETAFQAHKLTFGSFKTTTGISLPLLSPVTAEINSRNLALQLNTVYQRIISCKESMWKELRRRLALRRAGMEDLLVNLGWDEEAEGIINESTTATTPTEAQERTLFEGFIMRFERDMRYRTSLADSIEHALGWQRPPPAPMSKYERQRAIELENAVIEAAKAEARLDTSGNPQFSRSCKTFIGFKEMKKT